jgi:2-oxoglutarate dehydrogenase E2 component (dihydrolipoamide succinyltransferase)
LNQVAVVTEHTSNLSQDGKRLSIGFPSFELKAKSGETTSAVFSTTWHIKAAPDDRVVVATSTLAGFVKSTGNPPPPPVAPAEGAKPADAAADKPAADATTPAATPAADAPAAGTPPADGAAPAKPAAPPVPAGPVAGDGVARVIVAVGNEATVSEWRDSTGAGSQRSLSKAVSYIGAASDLRDGGSIPVTVTIELHGGTAMDSLVKLNNIDLQVFTESAPLAPPPAAAPATDATAPAAPAAGTTTPAAPAATPAPATTPAPASGDQPH